MKKFLLFFFAFLSVNVASFAQSENSLQLDKINTDRPGVGNASRIVPQGAFQIEAGFQFANDETNFISDKVYHLPELDLRYGLLKFAELRFRSRLKHTKLDFERSPFPIEGNSETGLDDIMFGTKIQLLQNEGIRPEMAFQADFKLPIGSDGFKGDKVEPQLRLNFTNKLTENFDLHYNLGLEWEENVLGLESEEYNHIGLYTLALEYKLTEDFSAFLEAFGELEDNDMRQSIDFGVAYNLMPNLQLDAYSGFGLSEEATDFFVSAGVSFRLPN